MLVFMLIEVKYFFKAYMLATLAIFKTRCNSYV
jgi:hypothetical protein